MLKTFWFLVPTKQAKEHEAKARFNGVNPPCRVADHLEHDRDARAGAARPAATTWTHVTAHGRLRSLFASPATPLGGSASRRRARRRGAPHAAGGAGSGRREAHAQIARVGPALCCTPAADPPPDRSGRPTRTVFLAFGPTLPEQSGSTSRVSWGPWCSCCVVLERLGCATVGKTCVRSTATLMLDSLCREP
jgi:hypothetical protein